MAKPPFPSRLLRTCLLTTLPISPAFASDILDPSNFASSGTLNLTSGDYTIDTSGGPGGGAELLNSANGVVAVGTTYDQGGYSYAGGTFDPTIGVLDFSNVTIGAGVTITVTGANPLALLSRGSGTIDGQILANGAPGQEPVGQAEGAGGPGGPGAGAGGHGGGWYIGNGAAGLGPGGGEAPCGGPAICSDGQGGGYGGGGINGPFTDYSPTYGNLAQQLLAGSGGSGAGVAIFAQYGPGGGGGGGAVEFVAETSLGFGASSLIEANGGKGGQGDYYGGNRSGGGLIFAAPTIGAGPFDGIQAIGGGGGRVLFLDDSGMPNVSVNVDGGSFGDQPGTVDYGILTQTGGVPEPGTWALALLGFAAVAALGSRRRRRPVQGAIPRSPRRASVATMP